MMRAARLSAAQRDEVRADIARRGDGWEPAGLAARFATGHGDALILSALRYTDAVLKYRDWLVENYRKVRTQRAAPRGEKGARAWPRRRKQ